MSSEKTEEWGRNGRVSRGGVSPPCFPALISRTVETEGRIGQGEQCGNGHNLISLPFTDPLCLNNRGIINLLSLYAANSYGTWATVYWLKKTDCRRL